MSAGLVVLVVAEDTGVRSSVARAVEGSGREVLTVDSLAELEASLQRAAADVVVAGLGSSGVEGQNVLHLMRERAPDVPVVVAAPAAGPLSPLDLLRHGAYEVVDRASEPAVLIAAVQRAAERHALRRELDRLRRESAGSRDRVPLLGRSERMREMSRQVDELAPRATHVLLTGATGTGKDVVARELHVRSGRATAPFVAISCQGVSETLLESQLFGHRRGAFSGAVHDHDGALTTARGGTIHLDRLEHMPLPLQGRLVSALNGGRYTPLGASHPQDLDVRIVSASNRDVGAMVRSGTFREDLHGRLASVTLRLPPLRERPEDVPLLAEAFIAEAAERFGVAPRRLDGPALEALLAYPWSGNVRELRAAIDHAFARGTGEVVRLEQLPATVRAGARAGLYRDPERRPTLAEAEAELVALVLEESGGNKTEAARRLGIDRKRLYRKIKRYSLLGDESSED